MITGHMQAASSTTVDHVLNKPWCEASRKKAHWDLMLEEMAWMANDFVQVPYFLPAWVVMYSGLAYSNVGTSVDF